MRRPQLQQSFLLVLFALGGARVVIHLLSELQRLFPEAISKAKNNLQQQRWWWVESSQQHDSDEKPHYGSDSHHHPQFQTPLKEKDGQSPSISIQRRALSLLRTAEDKEIRTHAISSDILSEAASKTDADANDEQQQRISSEEDICPLKKYAAVDAASVLNVHIVPHTHDDVGWRKTVEQYFYGYNTSIDNRGFVKDIITSSIESLLQQPHRTFSYVESKFLSMWWNEASDAQRASLQYLIANEQWTFMNGAWSMHDEACTHFMGMVDNTAAGHDFLKRHLGYIPQTGWQVDPFGHSATQAQWMTHAMGFNALYFGRIDYQDLELRKAHQQCEGLWNPAASTTAAKDDTNNNNNSNNNATDDSTVFWGLTGSYGGNYGTPGGLFCYDVLCGSDGWGITPILDMNETERQESVHEFLTLVAQQARETAGNDLLLTFGTDFTYSHAESYFSNLDLLLSTIVTGQEWNLWDMDEIFADLGIHRVNVFYSTPDYYTWRKYLQTVRQANETKGAKAPAKAAAAETRTEEAAVDPVAKDSRKMREETVVRNGGVRSNNNYINGWPLKTDDFFPYSDCPHCFWTGYFTSRTAFKRLERVASGFLQAARQLDLLWSNDNDDKDGGTKKQLQDEESHPLYPLQDALGVSQHHDSITGTGKQHVADDYSKRLHAALDQAVSHVTSIVNQQLVAAPVLSASQSLESQKSPPLSFFEYCHLLNESICEPTTGTDFATQSLYVAIYNPLAQRRGWTVRVPVSQPGSYLVERIDNLQQPASSAAQQQRQEHVQEERVRASPFANPQMAVARSARFPKSENDATTTKVGTVYEIEFYAGPLIPLGAITYKISLQGPGTPWNDEEQRDSDLVQFTEHTVQALNGRGLIVDFDRQTGELKHVTARHHSDGHYGVNMDLQQEWGYYIPYDHTMDWSSDDRENSGAYIFRPSTPNQTLQPLKGHGPPRFVVTNRGVEVHTQYGGSSGGSNGNWIHQVARVAKDDPWIEFEFTVGPVPIEYARGKEVVSRFVAPEIDNHGVFYTDSNARAFLKRQVNVRPTWEWNVSEPVAGNYYPVNAAIYIENGDGNASLALVVDRSRGGASLVKGSVEVKVQRRTVVDDNRGVEEPLNETTGGMTPYPPFGDATRIGDGVVIRGTHRLLVGNGGGAKLARGVMDGVFSQPVLLFGSAPLSQNVSDLLARPSFAVLAAQKELPPNVFLMTLKRIYDRTDAVVFLIRLAHQYGPGEDEVLSKPVQVNLSVLLDSATYKLVSVAEKTLSGNQDLKDFVARRYNWTSPTSTISADAWKRPTHHNSNDEQDDDDDDSTTITLHPLDMRTFEVVVEPAAQ